MRQDAALPLTSKSNQKSRIWGRLRNRLVCGGEERGIKTLLGDNHENSGGGGRWFREREWSSTVVNNSAQQEFGRARSAVAGAARTEGCFPNAALKRGHKQAKCNQQDVGSGGIPICRPIPESRVMPGSRNRECPRQEVRMQSQIRQEGRRRKSSWSWD